MQRAIGITQKNSNWKVGFARRCSCTSKRLQSTFTFRSRSVVNRIAISLWASELAINGEMHCASAVGEVLGRLAEGKPHVRSKATRNGLWAASISFPEGSG